MSAVEGGGERRSRGSRKAAPLALVSPHHAPTCESGLDAFLTWGYSASREARLTHSIDIFLAAELACRAGRDMTARSANDKEYFPQDWFIDRLGDAGVPFTQQGRNEYPDFWVGNATHEPVEGFEIKSLAFANGRPARKDYDCNSSLPVGVKNGRNCFLAFFLYTNGVGLMRPVHSLCVAHQDIINVDMGVTGDHVNHAIHDFGSFGDGFIRDRKMYVFPHPLALRPAGIGRRTLIVPASWGIQDPRLRHVQRMSRVMTSNVITGYEIDLVNVSGTPRTAPNARGGESVDFDVFEAA